MPDGRLQAVGSGGLRARFGWGSARGRIFGYSWTWSGHRPTGKSHDGGPLVVGRGARDYPDH